LNVVSESGNCSPYLSADSLCGGIRPHWVIRVGGWSGKVGESDIPMKVHEKKVIGKKMPIGAPPGLSTLLGGRYSPGVPVQ
jgi:hypothetical protein